MKFIIKIFKFMKIINFVYILIYIMIHVMPYFLFLIFILFIYIIGAGVGSADATPLAAALVWVFKDGLGMISSLTFAYHYCDVLEMYAKEWRLFADFLNNVGLFLDLLCSQFPRQFLLLSSLSTVSKSCCGLIAGSTKARISAHFALGGRLADVTAKESTQETAGALSGLVIGIYINSD